MDMDDLNTNQIEKQLIRQLADILSCDANSIRPETALHALGVDSLSFVELLVFIEHKYKIKLMESELSGGDFRTIRSLAKCIRTALT